MGWQKVAIDLGRSSQTAKGVFGLARTIALLVPIAVQVQLFPYAYAYAAPQTERLGACLTTTSGESFLTANCSQRFLAESS